jgi:hypothetical protein
MIPFQTSRRLKPSAPLGLSTGSVVCVDLSFQRRDESGQRDIPALRGPPPLAAPHAYFPDVFAHATSDGRTFATKFGFRLK